MNDPLIKELWARHADSVIKQHVAWLNSPMMVAERERREREWRAKPWRERAAIRSRVWVSRKRERLGEFVAGREFE